MENLTVVVPFRDGHATIERLLDSFPADLPVLIVDDQSRVPYQLDRPHVRVLRLAARGYFAGAVNRGIREGATDVLVLNQDVWFEGDAWFQLLAERRAEYALVGDGVMQNPKWPRGYVQGTCMFLRRDAIERVGPLNERDYPLWGTTCEWQLRACRAGFKALPLAVPGLHHARQGQYGASIAQALREQPEQKEWFLRTPPMISVVIPCQNYGRFLPDALASLVGGDTFLGRMPGQTFQSFEVVLVDYGSTDDSVAIARSLADDWKGVRLVQTPNEGTAEACNAGVRAAHGAYLAMLDADDLMEPERLEKMFHLAEDHPHAVVFDDIRLVQYGRRTGVWDYPEYDFEVVLQKNSMPKGLLFPKAAWEEVGGYPKLMTDGREDWAFNIALGEKGWCGVHLKEPLYLYRRAGHNRSDRNTNPLWRQRFLEKLHYLFPHLYAGERPMGCCGGNPKRWKGKVPGATNGKPLSAGVAATLPGAEGLVLLEYIAPDQIDLRPFHGPATNTPYWFGRVRLKGYVDARDVKGFCEFMGGRAFRVWTPETHKGPA